MMVAPH